MVARKERGEERDRDRERSPVVARNISIRDRGNVSNTSIVRPSVSPPPTKKRRRAVPRYMVSMPKVSLAITKADLWELKQRYQNMYIPSDFFHSDIRWPEVFTPDNPFVLRQPCAFQLMHKEIEPPPEVCGQDKCLLEPADADHSFAARVMLMSVPSMSEIYRQCFVAAEDQEEAENDDRNLVHPSRMISFLVGQRSERKNETMAIGGPWSPSLDGKHPDTDPTVLIRTAIRTCKALTGIDLSRCTQW